MARLPWQVAVDSPDECWLWRGHRDRDGYGTVQIAGRSMLAHRRVSELVDGPIPDGLCVLHTCDNPPCCNPAHLWRGTNTENVADRDRKGRQSRGERVPTAKLTARIVERIRERLAAGESQRALAREYGVSHPSINAIAHNRSWKAEAHG